MDRKVKKNGVINIYTMNKIPVSKVYWHLTDLCEIQCDFCPSRYRAGTNKRTVDEYLTVVEKLQLSRYKHAESIKWIIGGGEPLNFAGLNLVLRKIKEGPGILRLDTSGMNSWFNLIETKNYVDHYKLTHHKWQNESVLNFIVDFCQENQKKLTIVVPLNPGQIFEDREKVQSLRQKGLEANEKILYADAKGGPFWSAYSSVDVNRILGRADDYVDPPAPPAETKYVDFSMPPDDDSPSYTGLGCYAGVDDIYISHKGFASGSECGGRDMGNVFDANWQAPDNPFICPMNYCRSSNDRKKLRAGVKL
jgi:organic radical activating enzyme